MHVKQANRQLLNSPTGLQHIVWPPMPTGHAATLVTLLQQFEQSQWLSPEKLREEQHAKLVKLAAHAQRFSPFFARRMQQAGLAPADLATPEGLRRLPLLKRSDVQQAGAELACTAVPKPYLPLAEGRSSGSTGQPVSIKKTAVNGMLWHANMMREHFWHKRDFSGRIMNIRATVPELQSQKSWGPPVSLLFPSGQALGVPITFSLERLIGLMQEFRPQNLVIYPNTMEALAKHCETHTITLPFVEHIWSIGETLKPELRERISKVFTRANIEDDYSCNELGIMALQCPETGLFHVMAESIILEVLNDKGEPCAEGEVGNVAVTDLHNYATPMIRYEIGDYAEMGGLCACGRGLPTLRSIKGRKRNLVVKPDGTRHWPPLTRYIFRCGLTIHRFQLIQHSLEDVEMKLVVPEGKLDAQQEATLTEYMHKALDHPFPLRFTYYDDDLPRATNGKFEDFICKVTH